jgi:hypothetical protein
MWFQIGFPPYLPDEVFAHSHDGLHFAQEPVGGAIGRRLLCLRQHLGRNCGVSFLGAWPGCTLTKPTTPASLYRRFHSEIVGTVVSTLFLMSL